MIVVGIHILVGIVYYTCFLWKLMELGAVQARETPTEIHQPTLLKDKRTDRIYLYSINEVMGWR